MRISSVLAIAAAVAASASLSACAGFTVPGTTGAGASAMSSLPAQFLTDPNCAHHDEATLVTGAAGMPASFQVKLLRDCPARPTADVTPAAVASAVAPAAK